MSSCLDVSESLLLKLPGDFRKTAGILGGIVGEFAGLLLIHYPFLKDVIEDTQECMSVISREAESKACVIRGPCDNEMHCLSLTSAFANISVRYILYLFLGLREAARIPGHGRQRISAHMGKHRRERMPMAQPSSVRTTCQQQGIIFTEAAGMLPASNQTQEADQAANSLACTKLLYFP